MDGAAGRDGRVADLPARGPAPLRVRGRPRPIVPFRHRIDGAASPPPTLARAVIITIPAMALAWAALAVTAAIVSPTAAGATGLTEAMGMSALFVWAAGIGGHILVGVLLWGHAHRPRGWRRPRPRWWRSEPREDG